MPPGYYNPTKKPKADSPFWVPVLDTIIKAYAGKSGASKISEPVILNAFVYRRYPYPAGARGKEFIRRGKKGKTHNTKASDPKPKTRHTRADMIHLRAVQRVKVRMAMTDDGTVWVRIDMFLDREKAFGWMEWKGGWYFAGRVDVYDPRFTIEGQAEVWHDLGFMVRGMGVSQKTLTFFQGLKTLR
jgi:hypothetical protein